MLVKFILKTVPIFCYHIYLRHLKWKVFSTIYDIIYKHMNPLPFTNTHGLFQSHLSLMLGWFKCLFQSNDTTMLEVYMDDMIVKSEQEVDHVIHLKKVFEQTQKYNMRLNPKKCTFVVWARKFLDFYRIERGIEANSDECWVPNLHFQKMHTNVERNVDYSLTMHGKVCSTHSHSQLII